jgi:hypothetical protein
MFKLLQMRCASCGHEQEELVQRGEVVACVLCPGTMIAVFASNTVPHNPEVESVMQVRGVKRANVSDTVRHRVRNG